MLGYVECIIGGKVPVAGYPEYTESDGYAVTAGGRTCVQDVENKLPGLALPAGSISVEWAVENTLSGKPLLTAGGIPGEWDVVNTLLVLLASTAGSISGDWP